MFSELGTFLMNNLEFVTAIGGGLIAILMITSKKCNVRYHLSNNLTNIIIEQKRLNDKINKTSKTIF